MEKTNVESAPKRRLNRLGIYAAGSYLSIIVVVYAVGISTPDQGYGWVTFFLLGMPWSLIVAAVHLDPFLFPLPCLMLNAGILYLLGTLFGKHRRPVS